MIGEQITVTTSPTLLVNALTTSHVNYPESLILYVPSNGATVFIGGSTVTTSGFGLIAGAALAIDIVNDAVYGTVAANTQVVHVLRRF